MDDETRQHLEAMEARLMSRITGAQEALIERIRTVEASVGGLAASVAALTELARTTNTTLGGLTTEIRALHGQVSRLRLRLDTATAGA